MFWNWFKRGVNTISPGDFSAMQEELVSHGKFLSDIHTRISRVERKVYRDIAKGDGDETAPPDAPVHSQPELVAGQDVTDLIPD